MKSRWSFSEFVYRFPASSPLVGGFAAVVNGSESCVVTMVLLRRPPSQASFFLSLSAVVASLSFLAASRRGIPFGGGGPLVGVWFGNQDDNSGEARRAQLGRSSFGFLRVGGDCFI